MFFDKFAFRELGIKGRLVSQTTNSEDTFKFNTLFYGDLCWDCVINIDD